MMSHIEDFLDLFIRGIQDLRLVRPYWDVWPLLGVTLAVIITGRMRISGTISHWSGVRGEASKSALMPCPTVKCSIRSLI